MRLRSSILVTLLIVLLSSFLVTGAPDFKSENSSSVTLNPLDRGITVHQVSVDRIASPIRIKELTIMNYGNASENELDGLEVRYRQGTGDWNSVSLEDLSGISSGITFTLPEDGLRVMPGEKGLFQFDLSVANPEMVPISKYGSDVTVKLGARFHFVYLDEDGDALDSVSSNFVVDPGRDEIARGGFEETASLSPGGEILQPGTMTSIGNYVFRDQDSNRDGVEVDLITVTNRSKGPDPLILGQDITGIRLKLEIKEAGSVTERVITKKISTPTSKVSFSTSPAGWWDGRCLDGCTVNMEVIGEISASGPTQGMQLRTGVTLRTKENNGMTGYPFRQSRTVSDNNTQKIVSQGLEGIEETTDWQSGVINLGEEYRQRLILSDSDLDGQDFVIDSIRLNNEGTLSGLQVSDVSVYRVEQGGNLVELGSGLPLSGEWKELDSDEGGRISDDGRGVFEIHYEIAPDAKTGATFKPAVQFQGQEGVAEKARSPFHESPESLVVYPWGAEKIEAGRKLNSGPSIPDEQAMLVQRIDVMDRDENRLDLLINPIVVQNKGTATGSDFVKLALYDSDGELLAEKTDLSGLSTAGVTLGNLDGKTTVKDNQVGNWRSFYLYLTPKTISNEKTVDLKTTLYETEGERDVVAQLDGPRLTLGRRRTTAGRARVPGPAVDQPAAGDLGENFGFGLAGGISYPGLFSLNTNIFLDYTMTGVDVFEDEAIRGAGFTRFGLDVGSVPDSGYYYPNASIGYKWPVEPGTNQFGGVGAGAVYFNAPDISSSFAFHGLYGVTTTELLEEDLPLLFQAKYKYFPGPTADSVLEISFGILYN